MKLDNYSSTIVESNQQVLVTSVSPFSSRAASLLKHTTYLIDINYATGNKLDWFRPIDEFFEKMYVILTNQQ